MSQPDEFITYLNKFFPQYADLYTSHQLSMETKRTIDNVYYLYRNMCYYCNNPSTVQIDQKMCYRCFIENELKEIQNKIDEIFNSEKSYEEKFTEIMNFIDGQFHPMSMEYRKRQKEEGEQDWMNKKFMEIYEHEFYNRAEMNRKIDEETRNKKRKLE